MIGVLIAAHGSMGESLIQSASYVLGNRPDQLLAIDLMSYGDLENMLPAAQSIIEQLDTGDGVLVLTDIFGATPCNTICKLIRAGRVEAVAGVNLPMLLKVLTVRTGSVVELAERAVRGGESGILPIDTYQCNA